MTPESHIAPVAAIAVKSATGAATAMGVWAIFALALIAGVARVVLKWVGGMPDRKRADNEAVTVESAANDVLMKRMLAELQRMSVRIEKLEVRVDELEESERGLIAERDAALAENARLRAVNQGQGEVRQQVAAIVAADRLEKRAGGV